MVCDLLLVAALQFLAYGIAGWSVKSFVDILIDSSAKIKKSSFNKIETDDGAAVELYSYFSK